ncbi:MAG: hypothetical protein KAI66_16780, partial [Lentisphaeria bacterium]|nr:hypothetical protein [Lentisphaeria bacterium]
MPSEQGIQRKLHAFVQRKHRFFAGRGVVWMLLACLLALFAAAVLDTRCEFSPVLRWCLFGGLVGLGTAVLAFRFLVPMLRFREHAAIVEIEENRRDLGQLVRTSVELRDRERAEAMGFSPALAQELVKQADETLGKAELSALVPWRRVGKVAAAVAFVLVAFLLTAVFWPDFRVGAQRLVFPATPLAYTTFDIDTSGETFERGQTVRVRVATAGRPVSEAELQCRPLDDGEWRALPMARGEDARFAANVDGWTESFELRVRAGYARSRSRIMAFLDPPFVQKATATLTFPTYTGLAPNERPLRTVGAVEGTVVTLRFELNHGLAHGRIVSADGLTMNLPTGTDCPEIDWRLPVGRHAFVVEGADADGLPLKPFEFVLRGIPDRLPKLTIKAPESDICVTPITEVPVSVRIRDDFGLAGAELVLTIDGREHVVRRLVFDKKPRTTGRIETTIRLEDYGVAPKANVRLHAVAADCNPRGGKGVSAIRGIEIRPFRLEYHLVDPQEPEDSQEQTQAEKEQMKEELKKLDDLLAEQREIMSKTLAEREAPEPPEDPLEHLANRERLLAEDVEQLREQQAEQAQEMELAESPLAKASEHLQEAAQELNKPDAQEALKKEDQALSEMLKARAELTAKLREDTPPPQQQNAQQQEQQPQQELKKLQDLAREIEELAQTERQLAQEMAEKPNAEEKIHHEDTKDTKEELQTQDAEEQANAEEKPKAEEQA